MKFKLETEKYTLEVSNDSEYLSELLASYMDFKLAITSEGRVSFSNNFEKITVVCTQEDGDLDEVFQTFLLVSGFSSQLISEAFEDGY